MGGPYDGGMVTVTNGAALAMAGAGLVLLLVAVVVVAASLRRRRAASQRLAAVVTRLDLPGGDQGGAREDALSRLERLAEAAVLRASEADALATRLAHALHAVAGAVVVSDEHGDVVYRNQAAAALTGPTLDGESVEEAVAELLAVAGTGRSSSRTLELPGPPRRTVSVTARSLDDGRRPIGAVTVAEDVSERRRLEVARRDLVANLTTEVKTPVGALGLLAGTIVAEDDPGLTRRLARRLHDDALRLGRIVDDLAELSRIDAELLPAREPVRVHLVVAQAVEESRSVAAERAISVKVSDAPRRLTVTGDRRQLVSAVRRLVENAAKFSPEGSVVQVRARAVDDWVEIVVRDHGAGIPGDELDRIFECFYRVDQARARDPGGTGLGLAIVSQVAGTHGGEVQVASTEGKGSTFTLRLPAAVQAQAAPAAS